MDVSAKSGDVWFALVSDSSVSELRKCRIVVKSSSEPESTGRGHYYRRLNIGIDSSVKPMILIRGIPSLRDGRLRTDFSGYRWVYPHEAVLLGTYGEQQTYLEAFERPFPKGQPHRKGWTHYSLVLKSSVGKAPQEIVRLDRWPGSPLPKVLWVGDLDRDGEPDLLINVNIGEAGASDIELFLSSAAKGTERVRVVARLHSAGC